MLNRLISSMPRFVASRFGIPSSHYVGIPHMEVLKRGWRRLFKREIPAHFYARFFTQTASKYIPSNSTAVIGFAGYSEEVFSMPALIRVPKILDRGSTHTLANQKLRQQAADYHGTRWQPHPKRFVERELREYQLADAILVPSTFVKNTFVQEGIVPDKVWQIPYGISTRRFAGLSHLNIVKREAVLFVGNDQIRKGIGVLIDAIKIVRRLNPQLELWVVGEDSAGKKLIDAQNQSWIKNFGSLSGQPLLDAFQEAKIFCLPSFEEGWGLVLNEAVQCGIPIVATSNTGAPDLIQDGKDGFIVPSGNPEAIAKCIITLLADPQLSENMVANQQLKRTDMTWEMFVDGLVEKITSL